MSLWTIAWRSIQQRGLASLLTTLSMALGVTMVVSVLAIYSVVSTSFRNNSSLGYNMIVGATKGGKLQLTLNTVYYLSQPVENIPYEYYLEFLPTEQRQQELLTNSLKGVSHVDRYLAAETMLAADGAVLPGLSQLVGPAVLDACRQQEARKIGIDRSSRYGMFVAQAIPIGMGDYFHDYRVVATTPAMFDELVYDVANNKKFEFAQGRNFQSHTEENGYYEAVVGATVARRLNLKLGDKLSPSHGAPGDEGGEAHEQQFTIVGILAPAGTPHDRAVFVNFEGFYLMDSHAKPIPEPTDEELADGEAPADAAPTESRPAPSSQAKAQAALQKLPIEKRDVTSILVRTGDPLYAPGLFTQINEGLEAQAALPIREIYNLFDFFVKPLQLVLLALTALICVVSGISILVSIYNSMSDRRHEIAVMRALGASRPTVFSVVLMESIMLAVAGGLCGWLLAHAAIALGNPLLQERTGVEMGFFDLTTAEVAIVPALVVLAIVVGFLPALAAYRTDVARSLGK